MDQLGLNTDEERQQEIITDILTELSNHNTRYVFCLKIRSRRIHGVENSSDYGIRGQGTRLVEKPDT